MWQHKQRERELRRAETDVLRQRKQLERSAQQYEASMSPGSPIWSPGSPIWSPGSPIWSPGSPIWSPGSPIWSPGSPIWPYVHSNMSTVVPCFSNCRPLTFPFRSCQTAARGDQSHTGEGGGADHIQAQGHTHQGTLDTGQDTECSGREAETK